MLSKMKISIFLLSIFAFLIFPQIISAKSLSKNIKYNDTFTFYEHGITFEYPSYWKLKQEFLSESCIFVSNLPSADNNYEDRIIINVYPYTNEISNEELVESILKGFKDCKLLGKGTVKIGGHQGLAIKVLCSSNKNPNIRVQIEDFVIPVGDKIYEIYTVSLPNRFEINKKETQKLISSIDFYVVKESKKFNEEKQATLSPKAIKVQPISSTKSHNQSWKSNQLQQQRDKKGFHFAKQRKDKENIQNPSAKTQQKGMISKRMEEMNFQYPKSWQTHENKAEQSFTAILPSADDYYEDKIKIVYGNFYNLNQLSRMALPEVYSKTMEEAPSEYTINGWTGMIIKYSTKYLNREINQEQMLIKIENKAYIISITSPPNRFEQTKKEAYKLINTITFE